MIDADSVLYAVALQAEAISKQSGEHGEDEYILVKDLEECYRDVVNRLDALVQEVGAEDAIICLTPAGKSFRYALLEGYKANRATYRRPEILRALQAIVAERKPFRTLSVRGLEADDICGISSTKLQKAGLREPVIVSIDKDMLQIPGLNYSWLTAARSGTVGEVREVSGFEADRHHLYQTLVGDVVDNYTGCPGIGPKKADKILSECAVHQGELDWRWILRAFHMKGYGVEYALTQARVARILRDTDWNPNTKEVTLWQPPKVFSPMKLPEAVSTKGKTSDKPFSISDMETKKYPSLVILDERKGATLH